MTRPLATIGFGALPTSSMVEDSSDHTVVDQLAEEEGHYIDDSHHLVPSSGQEEGSSGRDVVIPGDHNGEDNYPNDLIPDLDLDILVDSIVSPVPSGHLNADAAIIVPITGGR
ncbi:hypothetical protein OsI_19504 [Oryza sativa Indica Group]|uniref:Uncharacterized protein n=1 Tax=Oryza sativa subsp. indica TaxID=39946 RepID=A2Y3B6_ORYSI|nr:hypothetical protein OsI_19504 [Oryza sativa Indica Group]